MLGLRITVFISGDQQSQAGKRKVESCLLHMKLCPFRKTKAALVQLLWKDLFRQASGNNPKTDSQRTGRGFCLARAEVDTFLPRRLLTPRRNAGCSFPSGCCNHL